MLYHIAARLKTSNKYEIHKAVQFIDKCNMCQIVSMFPVFCSHHRSWKYYAESVNNEFGFPASRCRKWSDFLTGRCSSEFGTAYMGIAASAR